jgi:hypothetical protein
MAERRRDGIVAEVVRGMVLFIKVDLKMKNVDFGQRDRLVMHECIFASVIMITLKLRKRIYSLVTAIVKMVKRFGKRQDLA